MIRIEDSGANWRMVSTSGRRLPASLYVASEIRSRPVSEGERSGRTDESGHSRVNLDASRLVEKQVPPPEAPAPKRLSVVRTRSTAVAVPPGKRNGWEHQDLRRRHLLVSEIENVPRTPISAVARPLRKHSTPERRFHQLFPQVFSRRIRASMPAPIRAAEPNGSALLRLAEPREELAVRGKLVLALGSDAARRSSRPRRKHCA